MTLPRLPAAQPASRAAPNRRSTAPAAHAGTSSAIAASQTNSVTYQLKPALRAIRMKTAIATAAAAPRRTTAHGRSPAGSRRTRRPPFDRASASPARQAAATSMRLAMSPIPQAIP
jgi:hypothetical protein